MTKVDKTGSRYLTSTKNCQGKGEGGFAPHPEVDKSDKPAPFDPHAYRPNIEPPGMKPVKKNPQDFAD